MPSKTPPGIHNEPMFTAKTGEWVGMAIGAAINLIFKAIAIAACGRYLDWW